MLLRRSLHFKPGLNYFQISSRTLRGIETGTSNPAPSSSSQDNVSSTLSTEDAFTSQCVVPTPSYDIKSSALSKLDSTTLQSPLAPEFPDSQTKGAVDIDEIPPRIHRRPDDITKNQHLVASLSKIARISAKLLEQSRSWNAQLQHIRNFAVTEPGLQRTAAENVSLKAATLDVKRECEQNIETLLALRRTLVARLEILHPQIRYIKTTSPGESIESEFESGRSAAEQASRGSKEPISLNATNISKWTDLWKQGEAKWGLKMEVNSPQKAEETNTEGRGRTHEEALDQTKGEIYADQIQAGDTDWSAGKPGRLHEVHKRIKERMHSGLAKDQSSPP